MTPWTYASWTMAAHHVSHGGYNRVDAGKSKSRGFAIGSIQRRISDWTDWMYPEAWNAEHNRLHWYSAIWSTCELAKVPCLSSTLLWHSSCQSGNGFTTYPTPSRNSRLRNGSVLEKNFHTTWIPCKQSPFDHGKQSPFDRCCSLRMKRNRR